MISVGLGAFLMTIAGGGGIIKKARDEIQKKIYILESKKDMSTTFNFHGQSKTLTHEEFMKAIGIDPTK